MSQKQAKRMRKAAEVRKQSLVTVNHDIRVMRDNVLDYLLSLLKRFAGYSCVSISAPGSLYKSEERKNIVPITVHKSVPATNEHGQYRSDKDIIVEAICIDNSDFKGVVIDRHGNGVFGNPFAPVTSEQQQDLPNLGDENASPAVIEKAAVAAEFGDDEVVESL